MKLSLTVYLILLFLHSFSAMAAAQQQQEVLSSYPKVYSSDQAYKDLELIRARVTKELLKEEAKSEEVSRLLKSIRPDGSWPGINYEDTTKTGFQHSVHLTNMLTLALAYRQPSSAYFSDKNLKQKIDTAFNFWLSNDFICENWWWNQIGTPRSIVNLLLIMDEELTDKQKQGAARIMSRATLKAWGARPGGDLIKIAGIHGKYGLFLRDTAIVTKVMQVIPSEIQYASERNTPDDLRGLQQDMSFHHRQDRVTSTLSYGLGYAAAFAEWAALVTGTQYAFPEEDIRLLVDFYLDGICKTMVHGKYPDPGAKNRSISRQATLAAANTQLPEMLLLSTDYRQQELQEIISIRKGQMMPKLESNRFYWHSEYQSHQRPDYFASVRMYSSRNHNMEEPYNGEGLKNHHLADGSNFISRTGREYLDIFPVWDWQKVPGTTVVQKPDLPSEEEIQKKGLTDFVGAVSDGKYGAAAFDFRSVHDELQARKAWFFFDEQIVCLGAGINSNEEFTVATTLNQSLRKGQVLYASGEKVRELKKGTHRLKKVNWVYHDSIAYFFPQAVRLHVAHEVKTGSWRSINRQADSPAEEVSKEVVSLWLDHGKKPQGETYAYIIFPSAGVPQAGMPQAETLPGGSLPQIIENSEVLQAVHHEGLELTQLIFYQAGSISLSENLSLSVSHPAALILHRDEGGIRQLTVADPGRKTEELTISLTEKLLGQGDNYRIAWDEVKGQSEIRVQLPTREWAGKSLRITFEKQLKKADNLY
ncbi:MAG: polysaccharide lyase family 8 super-sandwich domain-containing protein [Cyclobacteriaceae bacterium]